MAMLVVVQIVIKDQQAFQPAIENTNDILAIQHTVSDIYKPTMSLQVQRVIFSLTLFMRSPTIYG